LISALIDIVFKSDSKDLIHLTYLKRTIIKTLLDSDTSRGILSEDLMSLIQNNGVNQSSVNLPQSDVSVEEMIM